MYRFLSFFAVAVLVLTACRTPKNTDGETAETKPTKSTEDIISITHGTSFGHCRGYCIKEEKYTPTALTYTQRSWDTSKLKPMSTAYPYTQKDFDALIAKLDLKKWNGLEDRIGCPDCADRGSEYIILETKQGTRKVTFDAYSTVVSLDELLTQMRKTREEIEFVPDAQTE